MISYVISCCVQDCVVLLAPYPNNPNPVESFNITTDFNLQGDGLVWYARPQLFFNCTLCPTGAKGPGYSASHKEVSLVYFSTFEPIDLTPDSIMQTCWGAPPSFRASSAATVTPRFRTASRTIGVLEAPPPTRSGTRGTAAGSMR